MLYTVVYVGHRKKTEVELQYMIENTSLPRTYEGTIEWFCAIIAMNDLLYTLPYPLKRKFSIGSAIYSMRTS